MGGNIAPILRVLARFDEVFNVLDDRDAAIAREALAWAGREGKLTEVAAELQAKLDLSDAEIERQIAQRTEAKKARNFAKADAIRNDLAAKGILIEDSKGGVRWKRK
jgi:cysteinyl-tRNA synthetase